MLEYCNREIKRERKRDRKRKRERDNTQEILQQKACRHFKQRKEGTC